MTEAALLPWHLMSDSDILPLGFLSLQSSLLVSVWQDCISSFDSCLDDFMYFEV